MSLLQKIKDKFKIKKDKKLEKYMQEKAEEATLDDPLFVARINFEDIKATLKKDAEITGSDPKLGYIPESKFKIFRYREGVKSIDSIRMAYSKKAKFYAEEASKRYGIASKIEKDFIYINYDIDRIESDIQKIIKKGDKK